jgi:ABC-type glycerol-3-phosphate transport system substrate-binding protein
MQVDLKDNTKAVFDSTQALGALQWIHDRIYKDGALAKATDLSALGVNALKAVALGNVAMLTEGSWNVTSLMSGSPGEVDQWDVAVLPKGPAQRASHASTDGWTIFSGTKQQEGA